MTADPPMPTPLAMEGERVDMDGTGNFRQRRWDDERPPPPPQPHPVKDIVLPLAVVIALIANALFVGVAWGRFTERQAINEALDSVQSASLKEHDKQLLDLRDAVRDLARDRAEDRKEFILLEDYTRGRIDRLPYHPAPSPRR